MEKKSKKYYKFLAEINKFDKTFSMFNISHDNINFVFKSTFSKVQNTGKA